MTLHILTTEVNALNFACTKSELNCKFTPTEREGITRVRISDKGREITPELAYFLCETTKQKIKDDEEAEQLEEPLSEEDLTPNNVLMIVEDLPR